MSLIYKKEKPRVYTHRERMAHKSWCFKNDIKMHFKVTTGYSVGVIVKVHKGKSTVVDGPFKQLKLTARDRKWSERVSELYTEYYLKYNKDE